MKKAKFFFMSLLALVMCGFITSCNPADILGYEEYFIVLDNVETNLIDPSTGNSLKQAIWDEFKFAQSGSKNQSLGKLKSEEVAKESFDQSCAVIEDAYETAYNGVMPSGGYIKYYLSLRMQSANGYKVTSKTVTIR